MCNLKYTLKCIGPNANSLTHTSKSNIKVQSPKLKFKVQKQNPKSKIKVHVQTSSTSKSIGWLAQKILDFGLWILDFGLWTLDFGL